MGTATSVLITKCRRRLNEIDTTFHSDADLISYADEAQKYFVRETRCLRGISTTPVSDGTQGYALPTDFLALRRITFDGKDIFGVSFFEIGESQTDETNSSATGTPKCFYIYNETIYLIPIPGSSADSESLKIYYYKFPATIDESTDELEISPAYDDIIVSYMTYRAFQKDQEFDFAKEHIQECNAKILSVKRQLASDNLSRMPRFRVSRNWRSSEPFDEYY